MKKNLSIFALAARATLGKIILLILTLMAGEIGMFYLHLNTRQYLGTLEEVVDGSRVYLLFIVAYLCVFIILEAFCRKQKGSNPAYLVNRLSVSQRQFTIVSSTYNICCLTLLFAAQVITDLILACIYIELNTADSYAPAAFLAFYRNDFFHSLLPLGDLYSILTNVVLLVSLGTALACSSWKARQGSQDLLTTTLFVAAVLPLIKRSIDAPGFCNMFLLTFSVAALVVSVIKIKKGVMPDEED